MPIMAGERSVSVRQGRRTEVADLLSLGRVALELPVPVPMRPEEARS